MSKKEVSNTTIEQVHKQLDKIDSDIQKHIDYKKRAFTLTPFKKILEKYIGEEG